MPLNQQGYRAKRAAEWRSQIQNEYESATGLDIDWTRDTFLANIVAIMADKLGELSQGARSAYELFDLTEARGVYLDVLASLYGISRLRPTYSLVEVTLKGSNGTIIPSGSEVQDVEGTNWILQDDVDLGSNGTGTGTFRAERRGAIQIEALDIDTSNGKGSIVSSVAGWDSASNLNAGDVGRDEETDAELRARVQESQQQLGTGSLEALQTSLVEDVVDVEQALAVENDTPNEAIIDGDTYEPHSYNLYVYPQTPSTLSQSEYEAQIGASIIRNGPAGIRSGLKSPQVTESIEVNDGYKKDVSWEWVDEISIDTSISLETKIGQTIGASTVKNEIRGYFDSLDPGEDVRQLPVLGRLSEYDAVDKVTNITYSPALGLATNEVPIDINEIGVSNNISVSIS